MKFSDWFTFNNKLVPISRKNHRVQRLQPGSQKQREIEMFVALGVLLDKSVDSETPVRFLKSLHVVFPIANKLWRVQKNLRNLKVIFKSVLKYFSVQATVVELLTETKKFDLTPLPRKTLAPYRWELKVCCSGRHPIPNIQFILPVNMLCWLNYIKYQNPRARSN